MIATEEEARQKWWCPFARMRSGNVTPFNRIIHPLKREAWRKLLKWVFPTISWILYDRYGKCIASNCGMWRWHNKANKVGYCGLAGKIIDF